MLGMFKCPEGPQKNPAPYARPQWLATKLHVPSPSSPPKPQRMLDMFKRPEDPIEHNTLYAIPGEPRPCPSLPAIAPLGDHTPPPSSAGFA